MFLLDVTASTVMEIASTTQTSSIKDIFLGIAFIIAVAASPISTLITNLNQQKMLELQQKYERSKSCDKLIAELIQSATITPAGFKGFSKEALEGTRYFDEDGLKVFLSFTDTLTTYAIASQQKKIYNTISEIPFHIFPNEKKKAGKKSDSYYDVCTYLIHKLKDVS